MRSRLQPPGKVYDLLPKQCKKLRRAEDILRNLFANNGYLEVQTPMYEYYDTCVLGLGKKSDLIKFIDKDGEVLTLRPDFTLPIARMYAANMSGEAKLCYMGSAFSAAPAGAGACEFIQGGIELIGASGMASDVSVLTLAIEALKALGVENITVDIGHMGFFRNIIEPLNVNSEVAEQIRSSIDNKNVSELNYALDMARVDKKSKEVLCELITLFGGREVFDRAKELSPHDKNIDKLVELSSLLEASGYGSYVSYDLGMLHNYDYYTGIVFKGFCKDIGFSILSGGRYDNLLSKFFKPDTPAIGFALDLSRIIELWEEK